MKYKDLPQRWKVKLRKAMCGRKELKSSDFPSRGNTFLFEDGSIAKFKYSFSLTLGVEIAIFTEHCGYHIFQNSSIHVVE